MSVCVCLADSFVRLQGWLAFGSWRGWLNRVGWLGFGCQFSFDVRGRCLCVNLTPEFIWCEVRLVSDRGNVTHQSTLTVAGIGWFADCLGCLLDGLFVAECRLLDALADLFELWLLGSRWFKFLGWIGLGSDLLADSLQPFGLNRLARCGIGSDTGTLGANLLQTLGQWFGWRLGLLR